MAESLERLGPHLEEGILAAELPGESGAEKAGGGATSKTEMTRLAHSIAAGARTGK